MGIVMRAIFAVWSGLILAPKRRWQVVARRISFGLAAVCCSTFLFAKGDPPLVEATRKGDLGLIRSLLQEGASVESASGDRSTVLLWASYQDDVGAVDLLLGAGANPNAANDLGATPLWAASLNGSQAVVELLLAAGADPNRALIAGETPLMAASRSGYPLVVQRLIAGGAHIDARASRNQTALMWAVSQRHSDVVEVLLANGADVHARSDSWTSVMAVPPHGYLPYNRAIPHGDNTALMFAARVNDLTSAKLLLEAGADVNDADAWGVSAVTLAAHSGFVEMVELLIENGADPNADGAGFKALHIAIMRRDLRMAAGLLAHGADANASLQTWTPTRRNSSDFNFGPELVGASPLWLAARFSQPEMMRLLLDHGADPHFVHRSERVSGRGYQLQTDDIPVLLAAVGVGGGSEWVGLEANSSQREALTFEVVKMLVDSGVDIQASSSQGRTALDAATSLGYQTVVNFLTDHGAAQISPRQAPGNP